MKRISLKVIYFMLFTAVFSLSAVAFVLFSLHAQQQQTESALLEEARIFAREMDAVWTFMDNSQEIINTTSVGQYEFKGLHCAIVGKSVGAIFSNDNDYAIRYTNLNPRSHIDEPDEYETTALEAFNADRSMVEYYGIAEFEGEERFRYLQALEVDDTCLECHGEPVGELDITGHEKEGWTYDSVGGAISIVIPLDQHYQSMTGSIVSNTLFFLMLTLFIGGVIYLITTMFVFRPLSKMKVAFGAMGEGQLGVTVKEGGTSKELSGLIESFNGMATELSRMYSDLEEKVTNRTLDLQKANVELEKQRDSLERLSAELAQESEFKSDLLSMVNHELRTPLTSIITLAQISREAAQDGDAQSWEDIERNGNILLEMINNMLDVARSDAGSMGVMCEPMDLGDVVAGVRSTMKPLAQKYGVSFGTHVAPDVPLVDGDYEKTVRLLENLTSNAIKFTPDGGWVNLSVDCEASTGDVLVEVSDSGIGIAPEDQKRIFERFVQVDSTSTRKYNGSGLGLALVKGYAEMQEFSIAVKSVVGKGSTFTLRVPSDKTLD